MPIGADEAGSNRVTEAESVRDMVKYSPRLVGISWGGFKNIQIFRKIKKSWKLSEKRTKPKNFEG
jgi:hypothetical protein